MRSIQNQLGLFTLWSLLVIRGLEVGELYPDSRKHVAKDLPSAVQNKQP